MSFSVRDDFILYLYLQPVSPEYRNITNNHQVTIKFDNISPDAAIQIDGIARILEKTDADIARAFSLHQHPQLKSKLPLDGRWIEIKTSLFDKR